ncbi:proline-rich protein 2-like [Girardinichthys multiradiatus]|uniref:proline-rich protein 2-like n=1 Tax=Girardinichthys multiradiatus TaxID=208333 RepID=UPI001FADAAE3|nr:proline-rich protein 2-like [Girardinichthys multiradiatus]
MLCRPTTAQRPTPGQDYRRKPWKEGHGGPSYRTPANPTPKLGGAQARRPPAPPHGHEAVQLASPSIKAGPHPNKRRLRPPRRSLAPPQPADQGPKGTARTTNPKHIEPTRNHPANEQTPPQYEAETPDVSAEPSDARPAAPTPGGQSRRARGPTQWPTKDPSEPPPLDRKGTSVSNRNQDKEPETEPEPPKTKQRPQPSKANHPRRQPTPTPTFEQLPEHIRHWTPRLTLPHPLPQTLLPASRMCSLKEGAPAMRLDLPASFGGPYAHRYTKGPRARAG